VSRRWHDGLPVVPPELVGGNRNQTADPGQAFPVLDPSYTADPAGMLVWLSEVV
jgi:hypothetical protein